MRFRGIYITCSFNGTIFENIIVAVPFINLGISIARKSKFV